MTSDTDEATNNQSNFHSHSNIPLSDACDFMMRGKHPDYVEESEIRVLNQKAVRWENIRQDDLKYHNPETDMPDNRFINEGDIVINSTGVGTLGRVYFFREKPDNLFADSHITIIRADRDLILPEYLYYVLKSPKYQKQIQNIAVGSTGQIELNKRELSRLEISFPSIDVQESIIDMIRPIEQKIRTNSSDNEILEEIASTYFKNRFIDFEPYDDFIESELGEIPESFEMVEISDLCSQIRNGGTPKKSNSEYWDGDIPWVKTGELNGMPIIDSEEAITEKGLEANTCKIVEENTVLVALYGASVGNTGLLRIPSTFNQACCSLKAKSDVGYSFLFQTLNHLKPQLKQLSRGSAQQNISQGIIKEQKIPLPPEEDLRECHEFLNPIYDNIEVNIRQNKILKQIRDTLLPELMSGEVKVNSISLAEVAVDSGV